MTAVAERVVITPVEAALTMLEQHLDTLHDVQNVAAELNAAQTGGRRARLAREAAGQVVNDARGTALSYIRLAEEVGDLSGPQAAVAMLPVYTGRAGSPKDTVECIRTGITLIDRIGDEADLYPGLLGKVGRGSVRLYRSAGANSLSPVKNEKGIYTGIGHVLPGYMVNVDRIDDDNFPGSLPVAQESTELILRGSAAGGNPWKDLGDFNPGGSLKVRFHGENGWLTRFTDEDDQVILHPNELVGTDEQRFAFRLLLHTMGLKDVLDVRMPGQALRDKIVQAFAQVYGAKLLGCPLPDVRPAPAEYPVTVRNRPSDVPTKPKQPYRNTSLAHLTKGQLNAVLFASAADRADIKIATQEEIERITSTDNTRTGDNIGDRVRAFSQFDAFFDRLLGI